MVNWKYISIQLAQHYSKLPFGGHYNDSFLARSWASLFDFPAGAYYDDRMMSGNIAVMYNFFMTIAHMPDMSDAEKVEKILHLIRLIADGHDIKETNQILKDGGYKEKAEYEDDGKKLSQLWKFHPEILRHCADKFDHGNYLSCVNEACKAYIKAVQRKSGSDKDGSALMTGVFGERGNLRVNPCITESEKDEQNGIMFLSSGLIAGFRNPTSHEPAKTWEISKEKCFEVLCLVSLLFRYLDDSTVVP